MNIVVLVKQVPDTWADADPTAHRPHDLPIFRLQKALPRGMVRRRRFRIRRKALGRAPAPPERRRPQSRYLEDPHMVAKQARLIPLIVAALFLGAVIAAAEPACAQVINAIICESADGSFQAAPVVAAPTPSRTAPATGTTRRPTRVRFSRTASRRPASTAPPGCSAVSVLRAASGTPTLRGNLAPSPVGGPPSIPRTRGASSRTARAIASRTSPRS